ncbi:MAG: HAD-IA family hydrolase [Candidatus Saccharimonadales bacterium]
MIKAVIFDCFGVLVEDALSALRQRIGPEEQQQIIDISHASHRGLIDSEDSNRQIAALLKMSPEQYVLTIQNGEVKNQKLMEYIANLRKNHKTAMLSNISAGGVKKRFTDSEIAGHFDVVVASGDIGYAKPEPEAYEIAADRLGVLLKECVFTDDKEEYCDGARAVGMRAIMYENFEQFHGELEELLTNE